MATVRKPNSDNKSNSLNCADAKTYMLQASSKNEANLYVYILLFG